MAPYHEGLLAPKKPVLDRSIAGGTPGSGGSGTAIYVAVSGRGAGQDRADGGPGLGQRRDRARLDTRREIVSKWRKRFFEERLAGLEERPRQGRPAGFPPRGGRRGQGPRLRASRRARRPPVPPARPDIRQEVLRRGMVAKISGTTIWRWLSKTPSGPGPHRSWIFPRDPDFEAKAAQVLDLYAGTWRASGCARDEYVVSRRREDRPSRPAPAAIRPSRRDQAGQCASSTSTSAGERSPTWPPGTSTGPRSSAAASPRPASSRSPGWWLRSWARSPTHRPAGCSGSSTTGAPTTVPPPSAAFRRPGPRSVLVHTPIHASWLNQVEIYLSIIKRKALTPRDFVDLADAEDRLLRFEWYYEASAAPFEWKFTRVDLAALLRRLAAHQSLPSAA